MILREATIKYAGYNPDKLKPHSNKRVCMVCDGCHKVRWGKFCSYRDLCISCSHIGSKRSDETKEKIRISKLGELNPMYGGDFSDKHIKNLCKNRVGMLGKHHNKETRNKISIAKQNMSEETKIKMSIAKQGINREDFNGFIGKHPERDYVLLEKNCLKINKRFSGSHAHHISMDIVVYIPSELHNHIKHNMKNSEGMYEMNLLSLQYLKGEL